MKNIIWKPIKVKSLGGSSYEVMISCVKRKKDDPEPHKRMAMSFYFRGTAYDYIESHEFNYMRISEILPNSDRIYFDFISDPNEGKTIGRKLSNSGNKCVVCTFTFDSKSEFETITGRWLGEYERLKYDKESGYFYIDAPANNQMRWRI